MGIRTYDEICADIAKDDATVRKSIRRLKMVFVVSLLAAVVGLSILVTHVRHVGLKSIVGDVWNGEGK